MYLFTEKERNTVLARVIEIARADNRVSGGALVGSFAKDSMDKWSDIDITFGIRTGFELITVLHEWTELLRSEFEIIDHFDVRSASAIYRVILFSNGLELDLSVAPEVEYGPLSHNFKLLFGEAVKRTDFPGQPLSTLIGWGWHHVLHANSAINRLKLWQAEFWISSLRNHVISMKCIRLGLPSAHARSADNINNEEMVKLKSSLIQSLEPEELKRALMIIAGDFLKEVQFENEKLSIELYAIFQKALGEEFVNGNKAGF